MRFPTQNKRSRNPDSYPRRLFPAFRQVFCIYMSPSSAAESIYSPSMYTSETISPRSMSRSSTATFRLSPPGFFFCAYTRNCPRFMVILLEGCSTLIVNMAFYFLPH